MAGFFDLRLDFVFFLHGTALVMIASAALGLARFENRRAWIWLAIFAAAQAASTWSDIIAFAYVESPGMHLIRSLVVAASFSCLLEGFRRQQPLMRGILTSPWLHAIPLVIAVAGAWLTNSSVIHWSIGSLAMCSVVVAGGSLWEKGRECPDPGKSRHVTLLR